MILIIMLKVIIKLVRKSNNNSHTLINLKKSNINNKLIIIINLKKEIIN